jgi:hypothetical protein
MPIPIADIIKLLTNTEVLAKVLKVLFPDAADQVDAAIMELRKQRKEKYAKIKKAAAEMDIPTVTSLIDELLP